MGKGFIAKIIRLETRLIASPQKNKEMTEKYKNKYRIKSTRLPNWDYGSDGAYFITVCTKNREHFFGEINNGEMQLSEIGEIAQKHLTEITQRYDYAIMDEFIVMPNHIHAIVVIDKNGDGGDGGGRDAINRVSTEPKPKKPGGITGNKNPMLHHNISRIFNWYTGRVTFESRKKNKHFGWQSLFHDHIIRNDAEYNRIKNYIVNNPKNWKEDKFNNPNSDN